MKVKVGNKIYDGKNEPIMVILDEQDKQGIKNMSSNCNRYVDCPDQYDIAELEMWVCDDD